MRLASENTQDAEAWVQFMQLITLKMLPCQTCSVNFAPILKRLPLDDYKQTPAKRVEWVELARKEVSKHATPTKWLQKNGPIMAKVAGVLLLLFLAGLTGALIHRRCQQT